MTEREFYHDILQQTLLSGDGLRQRLRAAAAETAAALPRQRRGRRRLPAALRPLGYLAAALLLCFGMAMSIPAARAAILQALRPAVDTGEYLSTPGQAREPGTAIEDAVEPLDAAGYTVVVAQAADDAWQAWAEGLTLTLEELLYDGEALHIAGTLAGHTADFIRPQSDYLRMEADEGAAYVPPDDMVVADCAFSLGGAPAKRLGLSILDAAYAVALDQAGYDAAVAAGSIPVLFSLPVGAGLTGEQTLSLEIPFFDMHSLRLSGTDAAPLATLRVEGLTFDATAGTAAAVELPLPAPVALTGSASVFTGAEQLAGDTALVGNELLPLEGATLSLASLRQTLAGLEMEVCLQLPPGWTQEQCTQFAGHVDVTFLLDGEDAGRGYDRIRFLPVEGNEVRFTLAIGLTAEELDALRSLDLVLVQSEVSAYNGVALPQDGRVSAPYADGGWNAAYEARYLTECPLRLIG